MGGGLGFIGWFGIAMVFLFALYYLIFLECNELLRATFKSSINQGLIQRWCLMVDVSFERFRDFIQALEKAKLKYVVLGGFAVDGRKKQLSRPHHDVDVMCQKSDEAEVEKVIKSQHYSLVEQFDDLYRLKSADGTRIDLFLVSFDDDKAVSKGKSATLSFPKSMFMNDLQKGSVEGFIFTIPCDSFIKKLGFDAKHESDQEFVKTLKGDEKKMGLIKKLLHFRG
jgi:hypothetical protein